MATGRKKSHPERLRMFVDPAAEVVWAGLMVLDVALQQQVLRELASRVAVSLAKNPRTPDDKVTAAVAALYEAYELLGHSPSVRDYCNLRERFPDLDLPPESNIRAWLGCGWNECLVRALLPAPSDGDFTYEAIEHPFTLDELVELVLACADDLQKRPSIHDFRAWVRRPDVAERQQRRPLSDGPFRGHGGWLAVVAEARLTATKRHLDNPLLRTTPRVYQFSDSEIVEALREVTERLAERIGGRSPRTAEYHGERLRIQEESIAAGAPRALPSVGYISKRFGSWDGGLIAAALEPLGGSGTKSNYPRHRRPPMRSSPFTREDKGEALRQAWAEIGEPFARERYVSWLKGKVAEAELRSETPKIPTAGVIEREFGGWRRACQENIPGYVNPRRRWKKRPSSSDGEPER